jgi:hypothetical protein
MPAPRHLGLALILCLGALEWPASAAPHALIIVGSTGSVSIGDDLAQSGATIKGALIQRGFDASAVDLVVAPPGGPKVTRDAVLAQLKAEQGLASSDEFWLVLLGFGGRTADGSPAFQVSGPRVTVADLKAALDAIPARQYVFIGTSDSGAFVAPLLKARRDVLSATAEEGEIDLPRFPGNWAQSLAADPHGSWKKIAAAASDATNKAYDTNGLALGEHARLGDSATGHVLAAPFGVDSTAPEPAAPPSQTDNNMALINAADINVEIRKPNSEWETQPATAETRQLIAAAKATPNPEGFNAVMLEQRLGYRIGDDQTAQTAVLERIYIEREDAVWKWANFELPQDPPAVTTKLLAARIIQPDGSATVFNPAKLPVATDCSSGLCGALTSVFIPGAHAGCLVEISWRSQRLLDADSPEFSEELPIQQDIPVVSTLLQMQVPASGSHVHFKLRNIPATSTETTANGMRTVSWKFDNLPGYEGLPYDPPQHDLLAQLDISSLDSWDQFAGWYRRLASGSDAQDATVKAKAQELAGTATGRLDKIRKAFNFVSSLRYIAIEFGINGIRPRTPALVLQNRYGDCKDKANLLIALLADMGVDAHFCLLNRGSSTDVSFPSWQFNHAIAYVPKQPGSDQPDDLFLDTTDSTAPFPTLSPGDIGRNALVFTGDNAQFRTVTAAGLHGIDVTEAWQLQQQDDGRWTGTLQTTWGGLLEYEMRSNVRGLTPRQRDFDLQSMLARQLPDADFSQLDLTAADDLATPLKLAAHVQLPAIAYPPTAFDAASYVAPLERNRPLLLNNGQPVHVVQTVDLVYAKDAPAQAPAPFSGEAAGIRATASWKQVDGHTFRRTAELDVTQPLVASADYPAVRQLLRDWTHSLSH